MENMDTLELLIATGCLENRHVVDGETHMNCAIGSMEPLANPTTVSALARRLSNTLTVPVPDVIVAWPGLSNVILAFAVGVELDKPVALLSDAEGLVTASSALEPGQKVALLGVTLSARDATLARAFVESRGANLAIIASLIGASEISDEIALVSLEDHTYAESDCPICGEGVMASPM